MDKEWVDKYLKVLTLQMERVRRIKWALFEPTPSFYEKLESGDDNDLEEAATAIGRHMELSVIPSITYEWGLKMKPEAAGQIRYMGSLRSQIQIPLFYVGKPLALGAILAHELTHEFLFSKGIMCTSEDELEQLTDLTSIAVGLGKLVLNGTFTEMVPSMGEGHTLGYLSPDLKAYAAKQVNQQHAIPNANAMEYLTENALRLLKTFT